VPSREEHNARYDNLIASIKALQNRVNARQTFGSAEELEEIGLLTMQMAALEESIALYCEILLTRPELGGFHPPKKFVRTRQFTEKLNLYKMLISASGVLYSIDIGSVEKNFTVLNDLAEDRNTIIHGLLSTDKNAQIVFHGRGADVEATLTSLRNLTKRCHEAASALTGQFSTFYTELIGKKSIAPSVEEAVQRALKTELPHLNSSNKLRQSTLMARGAEAELRDATRKAAESQKKLVASKKTLRTTRDRLRRAKKKAGG
jgi:hypothetical protein